MSDMIMISPWEFIFILVGYTVFVGWLFMAKFHIDYSNKLTKWWEQWQGLPHTYEEQRFKGMLEEGRLMREITEIREEIYAQEHGLDKRSCMIPLPPELNEFHQEGPRSGLSTFCLLASYLGYSVKLVKKDLPHISTVDKWEE